MNKGIKLISLSVHNKEKTILDIKFIDESKQFSDDILTSVIIGVNGSGKSFALTTIIDVFRFIYNKSYPIKYDTYNVKYYIDENLYEISIRNKKIYMYKNKIEVVDIELPSNIMAIAFLINDKFPFKPWNNITEEEIEIYEDTYEYMGIRQVSNASWTSTINKRIADCIIDNSDNKEFMNILQSTLNFLGFDMKIELNIYSEQKTFFKRYLSEEKLNLKLDKLKHSNSMRAYIAREFNSYDKVEIIDFINNISKNNKYKEAEKEIYLEYLIDMDKNNINELVKNKHTIKKLIDLKFIKAPKIYLYKNYNRFSIDDCSSGEKQLIFTMVNIASKIKPRSLVLIDEPEISLHPGWQIGYIDFLKKILKEYFKCHIILATHSHYLVSDLKGESSSIVVLERANDGYIKSKLIENDTYAWSAENILYNIFQVRTTRNYYFEMDLREVTYIINNKEKNKIKELKNLIYKLKKYIYDKNDPLRLIIENAERFIENDSENRGEN